jgi:hypothetical protein
MIIPIAAILIFFLFNGISSIIDIFSQLIQLKKSNELVSVKNEYEEKYQFIKGLF